jgi:peptidoglycan hydrolase-like protein with peptidoglycan-binding domain
MAPRRKKKRSKMNAGIAQIPLALGAGAASIVGHALSWGATRFARSPMASTGLVLISGLTLMAATNALFLQDTRHPAPLFTSGSAQPASIEPVVVEPVEIPQRPVAEPAALVSAPAASQQAATPSSATPEPTAPAIGNQDIADLQEKLKAMGIFDGTVDGYYGPRTADAIRDFEARFNLPRTGAATPQVIKAVREAPLQTSQAAQPAPAQPVAATPQTDEVAPLLAQMQETAPTAPATVERQTVADISPDLPASATVEPSVPAVLNGDLVSDIQRGLSRLGFLQGPVNGVADEATARAIRQFQIFNNYRPTGEVSPVLRQMLVEAGAFL